MSGAERRLLPHEELKFVHYVARVVPFCFSVCILNRLRHAFSLRSITIVRVCMRCLCALLRVDGRELNMCVHLLTVQSSAQKGLVYHVTMNKLKNKLGTAA